MTDESQQHAKSLAEKLNLKLRGVVQRALPEYFEANLEAMKRAPETVFQKISDTQSLRLSNEYFLLERKRRRKEQEEKDLAALYKQLRSDIRAEIRAIEEEQERLDRGIFYGILEEEVEQPAETSPGASAPTNILSESKELKSQKE